MGKKKKIIIVVPVILLIVGIIYITFMKPFNINKQVWSEGIQIAKLIDNSVKNDEPAPDGVLEIIDEWGNGDKKLNKSERNIKQNLLTLNIARIQLTLANLKNENENEVMKEYNKAYKDVEKSFGKTKLKISKIEDAFFKKIEDSAQIASIEADEQEEEKKQNFISESDIVVTADEVQYNMSNKLDEQFYLVGRVEMCDYYNYGFTEEEDYFCGRIIPINDSASEPWYLYFSRDSFKSVYESLLTGSVDLRIAAEVPGAIYENGQENMAWVRRTIPY